MTTYVLDASAVLRFLHKHTGSVRVGEILGFIEPGSGRAAISAVNWGEVACTTAKLQGSSMVNPILAQLLYLGLEVIPASPERAVRAGMLKASLKIPYADAFCIELASDSPDHVLVTADFDMKPAEHLVKIEFLPVK